MTDAPCIACRAVASRREFLRDTALLVASAAAFPIDFTPALRIVQGEAVYPLPSRDGATIDKDHAVIVARYQGVVYAFVLWCPHQHAPLQWEDDLQRFECPKHHSKYQPNGMFIEGRATRGMDRYALRREGDTIVVGLATVYQQDENRTPWDAAVVKL